MPVLCGGNPGGRDQVQALRFGHSNRHQRGGAEAEASAGATQPVVSATTLPFLFQSGPGYWKAKPTYWIGWVIGLLTLPVFGIGFGVWGFLFIGSLVSKADWRKDEHRRSIEASTR